MGQGLFVDDSTSDAQWRALTRMASAGGMSDSEQDEGEHRASLLQTMDADMETDADTAVPLIEALGLYRELVLDHFA